MDYRTISYPAATPDEPENGRAARRTIGVSEAERRERQLAALYELWRAVPYTAVDRLLQMLAERATAAMDAHSCSLLLRERGGDEMTVAASVGLDQDVADSVKLLVGERIAGRVAATGQPIMIHSDPTEHPLIARGAADVQPRPDVESALCAPLVAASGEVLGVLCLSRLSPAARFTEDDLRVFSLFAAQAGSVIAQVRVGANLARREQELASFGQVAEAIRERIPENALLERLADGVQEVIGFERCQVWSLQGEGEDGRFVLAAGRGYIHGTFAGMADTQPPPDCLRTLHGPGLISDIAREHPEADRFFRALGLRTGVVAPLIVRGECAALVLADILSGGGRFREEMAETLFLFVGHVAVAIENARLFTDLERAGREAAALEREMARTAALASLGQLAATVAHELRNPLSSIKGAAQYLLSECDEAEDPTLRDFLTIVVDEVNGLGQMTTDLLEFARPSPPVRLRCDLVAVARAEADFLRAELEGQEIVLRESYATPAWTDIDAAQVGRALRNLMLNAAQAMPQGGRLSVTVQPEGGPGERRYALAVADTGPGVPEAIRERLFEPFFTTRSRGTGLGLAQVRQVATAHGGDISVGDAPGGGALFTLHLPGAAE